MIKDLRFSLYTIIMKFKLFVGVLLFLTVLPLLASACPTYDQCIPGDVRSMHCASSGQISYEKCRSDGSGWDIITESCPSGKVCESGYCVQECAGGYTDEYKCSGGWMQREYQHSDCTTEWVNYQFCNDGCSGGYCLSAPLCSEGYLDQFRCSGDWKQREYVYSDCTIEWRNYEYCDNYCSADHCVYESECNIAVDASTPDDIRAGGTVSSTITVENTGYREGSVYVNAYICSNDYSCSRMSCNGYYDPRVYVYGHMTQSVYCTAQVNEKGSYYVKVFYSRCGSSGTVYSGSFDVIEALKPSCTAQFIDSYRCSGNWRQQSYRYSDCTTAWVNLEMCSYGCSGSSCLPATTTTTVPVTTTTVPSWVPQYTDWIVFWKGGVWLWPLAFLLLAVLVLLAVLFTREIICIRAGPRRWNRPESFEGMSSKLFKA